MCGGSTSTTFPGPTPQEQQLEQEQLDSLKQQKDLVNGFMPFVLQQNGIVATKSDNPDYVNYNNKLSDLSTKAAAMGFDINHPQGGTSAEQDAMIKEYQDTTAARDKLSATNTTYDYTPEQKAINAQLQDLQTQALTLAKAQNQRAQDALNGKIGPSDALMHQEGLDFNALKEDQGRLGNEIIGDNLENATAKSTSGIQALEALRQTYGSLKSSEINNIIAGGPGQAAAYQSNYRGASLTNASQAEGGMLQPLAGLNGQFGAAFQPYQFQRAGQFQSDSANAANNQAFDNTLLTGLLGSGGQVAGGLASNPALLAAA